MVKTTTPGVPQARRSRLGLMLPGCSHRLRCVGSVMAVAAILAGGMTGLSVTPAAHDLGLSAVAEAATKIPPNTGEGFPFTDSKGVYHWLGANADPVNAGRLLWCIEFGPVPIKTGAQMASASELTSDAQRSDRPEELAVVPAQMAWILDKYEPVDTVATRAALSILVHANYDTAAKAVYDQAMGDIKGMYASVWDLAASYAAEARASTPQSFTAGQPAGENTVRTGNIHGVGAQNADGAWLTGVPVTVKLNGPAVFDATGTDTWTGTTGSEPLTLAWTATGNGEVTFSQTYRVKRQTLVKYGNDGKVQDMLGRDPKGPADPSDVTEPGTPFEAHYDFQPVATSSVVDAGAKVVDEESGVIRDTIHVKADGSYANPHWMYDGGELVPVVFKGTAYYTGSTPAAQQAGVPAGAKVVGTTTVTANGPGDYTAEIATDLEPEVVTWVWEVVKADQGQYESYVAADWSDAFGIAEETTSLRGRAEIDSTLQNRVTKSGTYLIDDLFVTGFDDDHGDFAGAAGIGADAKEMTQSLYFFPADLPVVDSNRDKATLIATVSVPAKNGYYPSVGATKFKMIDATTPGTYVFVTSFAGDDRTKPYTSSVEDATEQYVVAPEPVKPEIGTTATDKADGDKLLANTGDVTIQDKVCQKDGRPLVLGKTYTLTATAMDKATGQAILDETGKPYTGTAEFTPASGQDCGLVDVTIPASRLNGKKVVMFENVALDGTTVALHTDIDDEGQTVEGGTPPEVGTTLTDKADGDHKVAPGPVTLEDKVCPKNDATFATGRTYTVTGRLMDKATGKPVTGKDGKEVTASTDFTPVSSSDCARVTFAFDTSDLGGHQVVAFEKVYEQGLDTEIAVHEDINDEGQTVRVDKPIVPPVLARTGAAAGLVALSAAGLVGSGIALVRRRRAGEQD